ncbi:MAG: pteridine reductase [Proteobacteria bacterium]|jgi:pteridine reductase|nr:pteridine reductase [Pseudomonadota bacterium]
MTEHTTTKVALLTGAAKRIGAETARVLHAAGMNIVLHHNSSAALAEALAAELNAIRPHSVVTVAFNLKQIERLPDLAKQAAAAWGRIDLLVNNASTFYPTEMEQIDLEQWHDLIAVNLQAPLFLSQACSRFLRENNGSIVNIVDIHGDRPLKGYPIYSIAKAGLIAMTKSLARELAPEIRVNGVAPGAIMWPEVEAYESVHQEIIDRTALKREGHPRDIAKTVQFLSNGPDYITGQIIAVDGGRTLSN